MLVMGSDVLEAQAFVVAIDPFSCFPSGGGGSLNIENHRIFGNFVINFSCARLFFKNACARSWKSNLDISFSCQTQNVAKNALALG